MRYLKQQKKIQNSKNILKLNIRQNGFAILYSVLISSILLAIGLAIFNLTIKELLFSSLGRESQFAFYAADTGAECALYWDIVQDAFEPLTYSNINCAGNVISGMGGNGYGAPNVFTIDLSPPDSYCAVVSVTKFENPTYTKIESRGYNTCDTGNSRRVERAIKVTY